MHAGSPAGVRAEAPPLRVRAVGIAVIGVALVVALAAASVLMLGSPRVASYPDGSPEAALQQWILAVEANDQTNAESLLSSSARTYYQFPTSLPSADYSVSIDSVERQSTARVLLHVTIVRSYPNPSALAPIHESDSIAMVLEAGGWKLDRVPYVLLN